MLELGTTRVRNNEEFGMIPTNPAELLAKVQAQKAEVSALKEYWAAILPEEHRPADRQFFTWLDMYAFETIAEALQVVSAQLNRREVAVENNEEETPLWGKAEIVKYASGVMAKKKRQAEEGTGRRRAR
jgi:hypothetical protein